MKDSETHRRCVRLVELQQFSDERGQLNVAQVGGALPWVVKRVYFIGGVPEGVIRGEHGHARLEQFWVAVRGRVRVTLQGSGRSRAVMLDRNTLGLHVPPGIYATQQFFDDAMLLVLSPGEYDPSGYLHDPALATGDVGDE